ncbi:MarR family transcriptional regulator [Sulfitobacter sp. F26204]|uniref:MarR family winged helix-turn-helix transcriptional regulator n=1 Tax=Sulfitobacter sp. F26204 TaxID=2996014 RepID=UPI00225E266A|nr:MarR family transcriptional regulator [Sulfitobacter sp. F26204]MCX7560163.1 MarR family transcriptional regulator [Sulfitobacter sp. F26204]
MPLTKPEITPSPAPVQISDATLRGFVGYHMKRAFNVVQADLTHTLKPFGLRMLTYTALVLIADNPGLSQSQLAGAMDVERPNLVVIVDQLEQRGLITRDRVPTDRRAYALHVTDKGRQLYERAVAATKTHEANLLEALAPETRKTVVTALQLIQNANQKGKV